MPRKSGKDGMVEIELGATYFPMQALTSVSSPASAVNKKFTTGQSYISPIEDYEPVLRLDGVVSGLLITASTNADEVDYSAGEVNVKGDIVQVAAGQVSSLTRPAVDENVVQNAIVVDSLGAIAAIAGAEGSASNTRGAAGGPPFIPVDEVLLGYIVLGYVAATGGAVISDDEIDSASKERADIPGYKILYHDGQDERNPDGSNEGCIEFTSILPQIHNDDAGGAGDDVTRNVYMSWRTPTFEEVPDCFDVVKPETMDVISTRAYGDLYMEKETSSPAWTATFTKYWKKVNDILDVVKNSKRFIKLYPDKDEAGHWLGVCIITSGHSIPVGDAMSADVNVEGSGAVFTKTS